MKSSNHRILFLLQVEFPLSPLRKDCFKVLRDEQLGFRLMWEYFCGKNPQTGWTSLTRPSERAAQLRSAIQPQHNS
jgi:hypothetical protein